MIRVAHLLPFMSVGGVEQMVLTLCKFRHPTEFDCIVAAPQEGVMTDEIRQTGTPVYTGGWAYHEAMRRADVVNLHWGNYSPDWHALVQSSGKPYVTTLHGAADLPQLPAMTICTSLHVYLRQKDKTRLLVIPNGVDLSRFVPRPKPQREEVVITRVCRPSRCALYFWGAMEQVLHRYPQTRLWIVGNEDNLGQSSAQVRFLGIRRDIPEILAETDIFAYTPYPGVGSKDLVVMEALAMGAPCVVSDVNAVSESVTHGQNGFLTPFGDVDVFVQKIGLLVENAELRAQMGQAAVRIAQEQFDMRRITRRYEAVYQTVMDAHQGRTTFGKSTEKGGDPIWH
jgi:glycosyltransferase involved in cell wall biosynthesis